MTENFDFLLAKSKINSNIIDLSIGENNILREEVIKAYNLKTISFNNLPNIFEYAPPYGYEPLVEILENKYKTKVILTVGGKQGLLACFYALKCSGKKNIHLKSPYWAPFPSMLDSQGLYYTHENNYDCKLIVSPNNPDGSIDYNDKKENIPVIHDAAYYTHSYLEELNVNKADLQVFSISKMFGLSGLRLGYIVINDLQYYDYLIKFIEANTAGVSTVSQRILLHILEKNESNNIQKECEEYTREYLNQNRNYVINNLNGVEGLDFTSLDFKKQYGMFLWFGSRIKDYSFAGVNIIPGKPFGDEYNSNIRMNLAVEHGQIIKAVKFIREANEYR